MKKFLKVTLFIIMLTFTTKVFAGELNYQYSEWSPLYPSGLDERFIESEVRYKWYKFENGTVDYTEEYYTELDGYTRDDKSATTFYRYIMNNLVLDGYNHVLTNDDYCIANWCYVIFYHEPTMLDVSGKEHTDYTVDDRVGIEGVPTPYTIDYGVYYIIIGIISVLTLAIIIVTQKRRQLKKE